MIEKTTEERLIRIEQRLDEERTNKERLTWIEERLEEIGGYMSDVDKTLDNHMKTYSEKLEAIKEEMRWKFNLSLLIVASTIVALLAIIVTLIVKTAG